MRELRFHGRGGQGSVVASKILAVALFREGDLLEESDQLIDKQLHRRSMSEWAGFMKLDGSATACLDITT